MTSDFVNFLEIISYYSAREQYCIPERASGKIAMPEIFDMIAGSETGAIIGATLVMPNMDAATNST
jgi:orotate phosphoribosyltransferase